MKDTYALVKLANDNTKYYLVCEAKEGIFDKLLSKLIYEQRLPIFEEIYTGEKIRPYTTNNSKKGLTYREYKTVDELGKLEAMALIAKNNKEQYIDHIYEIKEKNKTLTKKRSN